MCAFVDVDATAMSTASDAAYHCDTPGLWHDTFVLMLYAISLLTFLTVCRNWLQSRYDSEWM